MINVLPSADNITKWLITLGLTMVTCWSWAKSDIASRRIFLDFEQERLQTILETVGDRGAFSFSYNAAIVPEDSLITAKDPDISIADALDQLLPGYIGYRISRNHVILYKNKKVAKQQPVISGVVRSSGKPLSNVSIYNIGTSQSTQTDAAGGFTLPLTTKTSELAIKCSRIGYEDRVLILPASKDTAVTIEMTLMELPKIAPKPVTLEQPEILYQVDHLPLVQAVVPDRQIKYSLDFAQLQDMGVQFSVIPSLGTNGPLSGSMVNHFSLNLFGGYSRGVEGAEVGSLLNITKEDVVGVQASGLVNIVGHEVKGIQVAGFYNNNRGSIYGVQGSGFGNLVLDTLMGVQASGFANVVKGSMLGVQVSGFTNVSTKDVDGVQASGFLNVAGQNVNAVQAAGFLNWTKNVNGVQGAGFANVATKQVNAIQGAGFLNIGGHVNGTQAAGFLNIAHKEVNGGQVAGFLNVAKEVSGLQIGLLNFADTITGLQVGLINFSKKGYHHTELSYSDLLHFNLTFKTGSRRLYNIITAGTRYPDVVDQNIMAFGYGLGTTFKPESKHFHNLELTGHLFTDFVTPEPLQQVYSVNWMIGWRIKKHFALTFGPAFRLQRSTLFNQDTGDYGLGYEGRVLYQYMTRGTNVKIWTGLNAGIIF